MSNQQDFNEEAESEEELDHVHDQVEIRSEIQQKFNNDQDFQDGGTGGKLFFLQINIKI